MNNYNNRNTPRLRTQLLCGAKRARTYQGYEREQIDGHIVFTAKRDLPEICSYCFKDISKGEQYTNFNKSIWHLKCKLKEERGIKSPWGGLRI